MDVNKELVKYIEENIIPMYEKNDKGHGPKHVNYVIKRCLKLSSSFPEINLNMIYTMASYHDIAHHINKDTHETLSANIFIKDKKIRKFFTNEEITIIREAIEDHRASSKNPPRSTYGKILSTADRSTSIDDFIEGMYFYMTNYFPNRNLEEIIDKSFLYMNKKYGENGYANSYVEDIEYQEFKKDVNKLLDDKNKFKKRYLKIIELKK